MNSSFVPTVLLPIALGIVMLGLGLTLRPTDFTAVARFPRAVFIALFCQMILVPAVCLGLVLAFDLAPELAVGMMLLAASPGGTTANLFSHIAGGDVALNITLTAINSVLSVITLPIIVNLSLAGFIGDGAIGLDPSKVLQVFAVVLLPVAIGMYIRHRNPDFAARMERPVRIASIVVLVVVIAGAIFQGRKDIIAHVGDVGLAAVLLALLSLAIGFYVPRMFGVGPRQAISSAFEVGIHNAVLAITIALSPALLNDITMAVPAAVYGTVMYLPAALIAYLASKRNLAEPRTPVDQPAG